MLLLLLWVGLLSKILSVYIFLSWTCQVGLGIHTCFCQLLCNWAIGKKRNGTERNGTKRGATPRNKKKLCIRSKPVEHCKKQYCIFILSTYTFNIFYCVHYAKDWNVVRNKTLYIMNHLALNLQFIITCNLISSKTFCAPWNVYSTF